jgi:hypothetical protein
MGTQNCVCIYIYIYIYIILCSVPTREKAWKALVRSSVRTVPLTDCCRNHGNSRSKELSSLKPLVYEALMLTTTVNNGDGRARSIIFWGRCLHELRKNQSSSKCETKVQMNSTQNFRNFIHQLVYENSGVSTEHIFASVNQEGSGMHMGQSTKLKLDNSILNISKVNKVTLCSP